MPLEEMDVQIQALDGHLYAAFTGEFTFDYIPAEVNSMLFPVPPDANNIYAWQDGNELTWTWSSEEYPTILPEMPNIPMIEWQGPFPANGVVFGVDYEHDLIKRPDEFIFFYALGTGKYFPTYDKTTTAYFDILLPVDFAVAGVRLDDTAHEYEVVNGHLMVTVESCYGPIVNDLIVSLVRTEIFVATDGNDLTGDGSEENPFRTIQKGIDIVAEGHTVIVKPGVYTGDGNRDIDFLGKAITVRSTDPNDPNIVATTLIDCNGTWMDEHRGFHFHASEDTNSILAGFTIKGGYIYEGGAIFCEKSSPTVKNCIITENTGGFGGGIACRNSNANIYNCSIFGNEGWDIAGGIYCRSGSPVIINCAINGNSAGAGGGIGCFDDGNATIRNSAISGNSSEYEGGGISCRESTPEVINCTISNNNSEEKGGGIGSYTSYITINNCILWDNSAAIGTQIALMKPTNWDPSYLNASYSNIQGGGDTSIYVEEDCELIWGSGNIDVDPCFVEPGYWVDANDPNIVVEPNDPNAVWINGDYHLKSEGWRWDSIRQRWDYDTVTSRCIDAGNPGSPFGDEPLILDVDPLKRCGENLRINMGAYGGTAEASMPPYDWALLSDITNDGTVDFADYAHLADMYTDSNDQLPADVDRDGDVGLADLKLLTGDWLKQTSWHRP